MAAINNGVSSFNDGKVLYLHQMTAYFDLTARGNVAQFSEEYQDAAGDENLQVNNAAMHIDEFENMPTNIAPGVTLSISEVVSAGGQVDRKMILTGDIRNARIGGHDTYLDNVCVRFNNLHTGVGGSGCVLRPDVVGRCCRCRKAGLDQGTARCFQHKKPGH